jgi:hypothetical protein
MSSKVEELRALFEVALAEEYLRGRRDERAEIAASLAASTSPAKRASMAVPTTVDVVRVAHGTIRPVVCSILNRHPGLTAAEVGRRAKTFNNGIAETSVANELRRNALDRDDRSKGSDLYRREGDLWFLAEVQIPQMEAAATAVNGSPPLTNGRDNHGAALATA